MNGTIPSGVFPYWIAVPHLRPAEVWREEPREEEIADLNNCHRIDNEADESELHRRATLGTVAIHNARRIAALIETERDNRANL